MFSVLWEDGDDEDDDDNDDNDDDNDDDDDNNDDDDDDDDNNDDDDDERYLKFKPGSSFAEWSVSFALGWASSFDHVRPNNEIRPSSLHVDDDDVDGADGDDDITMMTTMKMMINALLI